MRDIDYNEIQRLLEAGDQVICIDVRESFRHSTMDAGGLKIPYNEISRHADLLRPFVNNIVVVCCLRPQGSKRTVIAATALKKIGFSDVRELRNGLYNGWIKKVGRRAKLPTPDQTALI